MSGMKKLQNMKKKTKNKIKIVINGILTTLTYKCPFDHQSHATLGPDNFWMGDQMTSMLGAVRRCWTNWYPLDHRNHRKLLS